MTQKSFGYDHPAYLAVLPIPVFGTSTLAGGAAVPTMTGAGALSSKFAAFTNMMVKSLSLVATTIGTAAVGTGTLVNPFIIRITNNGTTAITTCTATYSCVSYAVLPTGTAALSTSAYVVNALPTSIAGTSAASANSYALVNGAIPVLQGDTLIVQKAGDATEVVVPVLEATLMPLANVTLAG